MRREKRIFEYTLSFRPTWYSTLFIIFRGQSTTIWTGSYTHIQMHTRVNTYTHTYVRINRFHPYIATCLPCSRYSLSGKLKACLPCRSHAQTERENLIMGRRRCRINSEELPAVARQFHYSHLSLSCTFVLYTLLVFNGDEVIFVRCARQKGFVR